MSGQLRIRIVEEIAAIAPEVWDACALGAGAAEASLPASRASDAEEDAPGGEIAVDPDNPFLRHAFLEALERSGSVGGRSGWYPRHIVVEDGDTVVAVVPAYLKTHSQGEYVFDHAFADAYERAGGRYYPKLQIAVPFTPVTGPRLLVRAGAEAGAVQSAVLATLPRLAKALDASSVHVTFATPAEAAAGEAAGLLMRTDLQFHWANQGYESFEAFLAALSSRKRKAVRRERAEAQATGLTIERLTGAALTEQVFDDFFAFYMDTGARKWGRPYLNRAFFRLIGERMADRIVLVTAAREGRRIAGAINFLGARTLYGRHWGAVEHHPFLHFELCYYQAIEHAIETGLAIVEAGAQGEHKMARGYRPVTTRSLHWFADRGLSRAVRDYLAAERGAIAESSAALAAEAPYRRG